MDESLYDEFGMAGLHCGSGAISLSGCQTNIIHVKLPTRVTHQLGVSALDDCTVFSGNLSRKSRFPMEIPRSRACVPFDGDPCRNYIGPELDDSDEDGSGEEEEEEEGGEEEDQVGTDRSPSENG
eukprot:1184954-Prorocentrum_minimum.AAC.4